MEQTPSGEWFETWFDSPFYHVLYSNHDEKEAFHLGANLMKFLPIVPEHKVLDIGCGRGRHAIIFSQLGMDVTGVDLSKHNIEYAKKLENPSLHFYVHDMLYTFMPESYDVVTNLFTSIGYFDRDNDNQRAIVSGAGNLKSGGKMVIDFFNTRKIVKKIIPRYTLTKGGVEFNIRKKYTGGYIFKDIRFRYQGKNYRFQERVKALTISDFSDYFKNAGLKIVAVLGNYEMEQFDAEESERLILVGEKV
ncbi:MAG: methyltransferase domain-containing protein [Verrucomicrobia bacterium]|nr:methyltransferase domain-containing protein [Cytophagales bacterium]